MPRRSGRFKPSNENSELSPANVYVEEALPKVEEHLLKKHELLKIDDPGDETAVGPLPSDFENGWAEIETEIVSNTPPVNIDEDVTNTLSVIPSSADSDADLVSATEKYRATSIEDGVIITSSSIEDFAGGLPAMPIEAHDKDSDASLSDMGNSASPGEDSVVSPGAFKITLPDEEHAAVKPTKMSSLADAVSKESQPSLIIGCDQTLEESADRPILAASANPSADNSTLNHKNSLEDAALVEKQQICMGGISPMKVHHQKNSSEQIILVGPETSQQIEPLANGESLPVGSFEDDSSASGSESTSGGDETHDEPSRRTSSLLAETREPSLYHGPSKHESFELQRDVSTQPPKDEESVTDDRKPNTNGDDAEIKETETEENSETTQERIEGLGRRTRSVTRFSDDTNMLKDFVNRVQARKATKDVQIPIYVAAPTTSLRRSPRKALAEVDKNSPSPQKPHDLANRAGTPPRDRKLGTIDSDDLDDIAAEPTTCRRSTRTRLFAPPTTAAGAPSCIPVRRADGEGIVPLPKSQAQELAIITRANTKRNKGQSKPPKVMLETLAADAPEDAIDGLGGREAAAVGWDERLVYFQEGQAEKRPKVRRMRKLGTTNGTPARKKLVAETDSSNGASAARGRSKSKGKS